MRSGTSVSEAVNNSRLATLQRYLREDPHNVSLLGEACDEAIAQGDHGAAQDCLATARRLQLDDLAWPARQLRLAMARLDWEDALAQLARLRERAGPQPALAHDAACVRWRQHRHEEARDELAPWLAEDRLRTLDPEVRAALQALWLRVSHHQGLLEELRTRALQWQQGGCLEPVAAGVASLAAVDLGEFATAKFLGDVALAAQAITPEALVARACVALGDGETHAATAWLKQALDLQPEEGRTWSALGMASLQAQEPAAARTQFARASQLLPQHIGTWHGLGWACLLLQDRAGALAAFQQALALDRSFAESHAAVGTVLLLSGRAEEAEEHLERAERLPGGNLTGRYARALQSGELKDAQAVRALAERLLQRPGLFRFTSSGR